jgi:uncharacterized membrane protein YdjX (TVP38/TMEM64 family)
MSRLRTPKRHSNDPVSTPPNIGHWIRTQLGSPKSLLLLFCLGLAIASVHHWLPFFLNPDQLTTTLENLGPWAGLIFMGLHIFATVMGVPGVILTMVGGICFGLVWGSLWSLLGATLGAIAAFGLARYWMHDWFNRNCGHHALLKSLNRMVRDRPFSFMLTIRFAPISPFNLLNFLLGLTKIPLKPYALGTFFGIIPGVIIYTWFGQAGYIALRGQGWLPLICSGLVLAGLSAVPLFIRGRRVQF